MTKTNDLLLKIFPSISDIGFIKELTDLLKKYCMGERVGIKEYAIAGHLYSNIASLKTVAEAFQLEKNSSYNEKKLYDDIEKLNNSINENSLFIMKNGLESILEIKLVLSEEIVEALKKQAVCVYPSDIEINMYRCIRFEIGKETKVELVKKEDEKSEEE